MSHAHERDRPLRPAGGGDIGRARQPDGAGVQVLLPVRDPGGVRGGRAERPALPAVQAQPGGAGAGPLFRQGCPARGQEEGGSRSEMLFCSPQS